MVEQKLILLEAMVEEERAKIAELDKLLAQESRGESCTTNK